MQFVVLVSLTNTYSYLKELKRCLWQFHKFIKFKNEQFTEKVLFCLWNVNFMILWFWCFTTSHSMEACDYQPRCFKCKTRGHYFYICTNDFRCDACGPDQFSRLNNLLLLDYVVHEVFFWSRISISLWQVSRPPRSHQRSPRGGRTLTASYCLSFDLCAIE